MPADTNPNGDIFGGWLLAQMDLAAGMGAGQFTGGRVVTVAIEAMSFHHPVHVGDAVCCYAEVTRVGRTSLTLRVQAWAIRGAIGTERVKVTEGDFTFVAIDEDGRPTPLDEREGNSNLAAP